MQNEHATNLRSIMEACGKEVVSICTQLVPDAGLSSFGDEQRTGLLDSIEAAVQQRVERWAYRAGDVARGPIETFEFTVALIELAECICVAYLRQKYGLDSRIPLTWTPDYLPLRWTTSADRDRSVRYLARQRSRSIDAELQRVS